MPDLEFKIKTPAELQGAEEAARAMEVNIGKAKALGKEYAELEQRLQAAAESINEYKASIEATAPATQKAADETERYQKALENMEHSAHEAHAEEVQRQIDLSNTAKQHAGLLDEEVTKTGLLNFKHSELKKLAIDLQREFPELGAAMKLALDPRLLGVVLLIKTFGALKDQIKATLDLLAPADWAGRAEAIADGKRAFEDASIAANEYWHELNRAGSEMDALTAATDDQIKKIHEQATAEAATRDAKEGFELAKVDADEKAKRIGPETAAFKRADIKERFAEARDTAKTLEENKELNALLTERSKLLTIISDLERALPAYQEAAAKAAAENATLDKERDIITGNIAKSNEKIATYQEEMEQREKFGMRSTTFDKLTDETVRSSMESEIAARDAAQRRLGRINSEHVDKETTNRATISNAATMESDLKAARNKRDLLNPEIDSSWATYQAGIKNRNSIGALRVATGRAGELGADKLMSAAAGADAIRGGGRASPDEASAINKATGALGLQGQNTDLILQIMSRFNDDAQSLKRGLEEIARRQADGRSAMIDSQNQ